MLLKIKLPKIQYRNFKGLWSWWGVAKQSIRPINYNGSGSTRDEEVRVSILASIEERLRMTSRNWLRWLTLSHWLTNESSGDLKTFFGGRKSWIDLRGIKSDSNWLKPIPFFSPRIPRKPTLCIIRGVRCLVSSFPNTDVHLVDGDSPRLLLSL